jgi:chromosome segregation ATPase
MPEIPTRSQWQALKKRCGVPDGVVKGMSVGKALDAWALAYRREGIHLEELKALETQLAEWIEKLQQSKSKVKKYDEFEKVFLDSYLGAAHKERNRLGGLSRTVHSRLRERLRKLNTGVQVLGSSAAPTVRDLEGFRSLVSLAQSDADRAIPYSREAGPINAKLEQMIEQLDSDIRAMKTPPVQSEITAAVRRQTGFVRKVADLAEPHDLI